MTTKETTVTDLDREHLPERFIPTHVEPGTPYPDEPSENIPEGWYVLAEHEPGAGEGAEIEIRINHAYDPNGVDISAALARKIADLLDGAAQDDHARKPRVFFNGDTIPAGVKVMDQNGDVHPDSFDDDGEEWDNGNFGPLVEVTVDYAAEVARARAERGEA
ncbi:hypothetical protein [Amycolatopsis thermophila]|uniref:Tail assembly chaperone n=1 Tax=Amycolatopsis thermophila TaxID=206084 RepID=A0ABU0ENJ2_9PSEU|nr:hypothetical protein [Amycolatopsis thermophila]MDQ0376570.1 hypothetical protein [Amycolatopsis thermophila]